MDEGGQGWVPKWPGTEWASVVPSPLLFQTFCGSDSEQMTLEGPWVKGGRQGPARV